MIPNTAGSNPLKQIAPKLTNIIENDQQTNQQNNLASIFSDFQTQDMIQNID